MVCISGGTSLTFEKHKKHDESPSFRSETPMAAFTCQQELAEYRAEAVHFQIFPVLCRVVFLVTWCLSSNKFVKKHLLIFQPRHVRPAWDRTGMGVQSQFSRQPGGREDADNATLLTIFDFFARQQQRVHLGAVPNNHSTMPPSNQVWQQSMS